MKKILLLAMMCLAPFGYANAQQESMNTVNTDFSVDGGDGDSDCLTTLPSGQTPDL